MTLMSVLYAMAGGRNTKQENKPFLSCFGNEKQVGTHRQGVYH
jgi:hypothetical protein